MKVETQQGTYDVVLIGCGLMGSALARTLARAGLRVAAWNRTSVRAAALADDGVVPAQDLEDAVGRAGMVLACTASYDNLYESLENVRTWQGNLFVNLTTGTPAEADTFATWAGERGLEVLDGSIFCYPRSIGTPESYIAYSGPATAWARGQRIVELLGPSRFIPGAHRLSSDLALGMVAYYISGITCFAEASSYLRSCGLTGSVVSDTAGILGDFLKATVTEVGRAIDDDLHPSDQARLETFAEGVESAVTAFAAQGLQPRLLRSTLDTLQASVAAGLGDLGISAQIKIVEDVPQAGTHST